MLFGPLGCQAVQRTFCIVFLVGDHAADANDKVVESLRGCPKVPDTHGGFVKIGMENWRQHAALRRAARIAE
jgi:hypothetical protein